MRILLIDYMQNGDGWGNEQGRILYSRLSDLVEKNPAELVFSVSLQEVRRTDSSFPREGVVKLAKHFRGSRGFCLSDISSQDLIDNWDAAALKIGQPLTIWDGDKWQIIGPLPSEGTREILNFVLSVPKTTTSEAATSLRLQVPNASNKLKRLWEEGYILRLERIAPSGGVEHEYFRIK
ncbi:MAG: DNA-binding protein [Thermodesulfobacteriota bacterium]